MSNTIHLKKGLDIKLEGGAPYNLATLPLADSYAVKPDDFKGFTPKLLVQPGDEVKAGSPVLFDKYRPEILVCSPVSGTVSAINRGEKRKILEVVVTPDGKNESVEIEKPVVGLMSREQVLDAIQRAGMWPMLIQRPYGIIADPAQTPKSIFISGFDSAPLAPNMNFVLAGQEQNLEAGIEALKKLTPGKIHLGLRSECDGSLMGRALNFLDRGKTTPKLDPNEPPCMLRTLRGAEIHYFDGPHPAGNVGVQIHHVDPVNKGETVWTIDIQNLAILGRFFRTGRIDMRKTIALTGIELNNQLYAKVISGASIRSTLKGNLPEEGRHYRIVSGNVLTGQKVLPDGYLGFYSNQITVIPEGDYYEFVGWVMPRLNKFSVSKTYLSWLMPWKRYNLDTNLNGGHRAFIFNGIYDKYLPMDIYPVYLIKAIIAGDIDKMENLGIYEIIEEDIALCEFMDPSKTEMQAILREGINRMIQELN
ncbi:MAG: Na(+)-translocating NADH-quinone reductase subunit A [Rikenellaceae bacterium]|nr:Na(+)-translocating NADH-quinone reductase subunit A [Rikenellaceae bacterium]